MILTSRLLVAGIALAATGLSVSSASAQPHGRLVAPEGTALVYVWRDVPSYDAGSRILRRRRSIEIERELPQFLACVVDSGTAATSLHAQTGSLYPIAVTEGPSAGCEGWVTLATFRILDRSGNYRRMPDTYQYRTR